MTRPIGLVVAVSWHRVACRFVRRILGWGLCEMLDNWSDNGKTWLKGIAAGIAIAMFGLWAYASNTNTLWFASSETILPCSSYYGDTNSNIRVIDAHTRDDGRCAVTYMGPNGEIVVWPNVEHQTKK
jgi:hypothetical protein